MRKIILMAVLSFATALSFAQEGRLEAYVAAPAAAEGTPGPSATVQAATSVGKWIGGIMKAPVTVAKSFASGVKSGMSDSSSGASQSQSHSSSSKGHQASTKLAVWNPDSSAMASHSQSSSSSGTHTASKLSAWSPNTSNEVPASSESSSKMNQEAATAIREKFADALSMVKTRLIATQAPAPVEERSTSSVSQSSQLF